MPILNDDTLKDFRVGHFGYSATRIEHLGAAEYTLATIVLDTSPSVAPFQADLERMLEEIVRACRLAPRADNLLLRLLAFNRRSEEVHGFKLLENIHPDDYRGSIVCQGMTALYDATLDALEAVLNYGTSLAAPGNDFAVNTILFVITDGMDNSSRYRPELIRQVMQSLLKSEAVESVQSILVGVNARDCSDYLRDFKDRAGFDRYVETGDADARTLARLGEFVSRSISVQSRALGTGQSSTALTF